VLDRSECLNPNRLLVVEIVATATQMHDLRGTSSRTLRSANTRRLIPVTLTGVPGLDEILGIVQAFPGPSA
jgi:hypothetical protein